MLVGALLKEPETASAQSETSKEYQIKAAFLFNFAQFVEWPAATFTNADQPFCIGILGDDPFGWALEEIIKGETLHNHKFTIQRSQHAEDLNNCQLIFICKSERPRFAEDIQKLGDRHVLTVSEIRGFAQHGGIINFYLDGNKVRFEINPAAAQREGLRISSQLLSLGKLVDSEPKESP